MSLVFIAFFVVDESQCLCLCGLWQMKAFVCQLSLCLSARVYGKTFKLIVSSNDYFIFVVFKTFNLLDLMLCVCVFVVYGRPLNLVHQCVLCLCVEV
jgi:hypothetical protein